MQSLRHAPHRLGPPHRPGGINSASVFSLRGDAFLAVVSPLLLLAGDIKLNPRPNCYACRKPIRRGMDSLQCHVNSYTTGSHKQFSCSDFHHSQLTHPWRCPPHGAPTLLTGHQTCQPSVIAASSQCILVSYVPLRLSTPCSLCKEMQWPLRPPGKVNVSAASLSKPGLGNSRGSADRPDTAARAATAEQSSMPILRQL